MIKHVLFSHDRYFEKLTTNKVLINDFHAYDKASASELLKMLVTEQKDDIVSTIPECLCKKTRGTFRLGVKCPECESLVEEKNFEPVVWAKALGNDYKFINPKYALMLNNLLSKTLPYLMGYTNEIKNKNSVAFGIERNVLNGVRTYKNVFNNIENILLYLTNLSAYKKPDKLETIEGLLWMYREHNDKVISNYIPMVSSMLLTMVTTSNGKYVDLSLSDIVDATVSFLMAASNPNTTEQQKDKLTAKIVTILSSMNDYYIGNHLSGKKGSFRSHVYAARSPFTTRAVISSIVGTHDYDEIHLPFISAVTVYAPHIENKLIKRGYIRKTAVDKVNRATKKFDQEIYDILLELIKESGRGLPMIAQRNPSLLQGSAQLVYVTKVKTNLRDKTISISTGIAKAFNADFDGDELNFTALLDRKMENLFKTLRPHFSVPGSTPLSISGNLTFHGPGNAVMGEYLRDTSEDIVNDTIVCIMTLEK